MPGGLVAPSEEIVHRHLQRSRQDQRPLAIHQADVQPFARQLAFLWSTIPALVHLYWRRTLKDLLRGRPFETWRK
jgi:hypothetical protein